MAATDTTTTTETQSTAQIYYSRRFETRSRVERAALMADIDPISDTSSRPSTGAFLAWYTHAGVEADVSSPREVWARWNRGSGQESQAFHDAGCRSLSVGDIVTIDHVAYVVRPIGWEPLPHISAYLAVHGDGAVDGALPASDRPYRDAQRAAQAAADAAADATTEVA